MFKVCFRSTIKHTGNNFISGKGRGGVGNFDNIFGLPSVGEISANIFETNIFGPPQAGVFWLTYLAYIF